MTLKSRRPRPRSAEGRLDRFPRFGFNAAMLPSRDPGPGAAAAVADHTLIDRIGTGAYGEVWLARNVLGELRAVKVVRREAFGDDPRPFEREFEGIRRYEPISRSDPSQVAILHVGRAADGGSFFYVMELADQAEPGPTRPGRDVPPASERAEEAPPYLPRTLRHDLKTRGRLPGGQCVELGMALTRALAHLHGQGLVHRDVKPSNIIFVGGRPKLADIGLVTQAAAGDDARSIVGTEGYLPTEGPGTPQADLYALGKVLYEALTGLDRRQYPELPADVRSWPDAALAFELNAIVVRACAGDPRERYASAEVMRADLDLLALGGSVLRWRTWRSRGRRGLTLAAAAALVTGLWLAFSRFAPSPPGPRPSTDSASASIFVLPFRKDGTNRADKLLQSRITDAVIGGLELVEGLELGPRRVGLLRHPEVEACRIARTEFDVRHLLAGSVRREDEQVVVALRALDAAGGGVHWSEAFTGRLTDLPRLELQIVQRVAASFGKQVSPGLRQQIATLLSNNWAAYTLYRSANEIPRLETEVPDVRSRIIERLNQAVDLDPKFAEAYAELALQYRVASYYDGRPREVMAEMRKNALRARALDPSLEAGHYWLHAVELLYHYDWAASEASFQRHFALNPNDHQGNAWYLRALGQVREAAEEEAKAKLANPPWGFWPDEAYFQYLLEGDYARAIEVCRWMFDMHPNSHAFRLHVARAYSRAGQLAEALVEIEKAQPIWNPPALMALAGCVHARLGHRSAAEAMLRKLEETSSTRYVAPYFKAQVHAALGQSDEALNELERSYEDRNEHLVNADATGLCSDPEWKPLRADPRFQALLRKVGLDVWPKPLPGPFQKRALEPGASRLQTTRNSNQ